jgi:hypothetical protein
MQRMTSPAIKGDGGGGGSAAGASMFLLEFR